MDRWDSRYEFEYESIPNLWSWISAEECGINCPGTPRSRMRSFGDPVPATFGLGGSLGCRQGPCRRQNPAPRLAALRTRDLAAMRPLKFAPTKSGGYWWSRTSIFRRKTSG